MGSQILEVARQGIWASFTGGWFYDPRQTIFCNTFHLYLWLLLLCLPFTLYLYFPFSILTWSIYCSLLAVLFIILKIISYKLHHMFDSSEYFVEELHDKSPESDEPNLSGGSTKRQLYREIEDIELKDLNIENKNPSSSNAVADPNHGQPDRLYSEPFGSYDRNRAGETLNLAAAGNLKVDIHHTNSGQEGSSRLLDQVCHSVSSIKNEGVEYELDGCVVTPTSSIEDNSFPVVSSCCKHLSDDPVTYKLSQNYCKILNVMDSLPINGNLPLTENIELDVMKNNSSLPADSISQGAFDHENPKGSLLEPDTDTTCSGSKVDPSVLVNEDEKELFCTPQENINASLDNMSIVEAENSLKNYSDSSLASLKSVYSLDWLFENDLLQDKMLPYSDDNFDLHDYTNYGARPKQRATNSYLNENSFEETLGQILLIENPVDRLKELRKLKQKTIHENVEINIEELSDNELNHKSRLKRKNAIRKGSKDDKHCIDHLEAGGSSSLNNQKSLVGPESDIMKESLKGCDDSVSIQLTRPGWRKRNKQTNMNVGANCFGALESILTNPGTHLASSHEDTSEGAVHCFQDERGNWVSYTFSESGTGTAGSIVPVANPTIINKLLHYGESANVPKHQWEDTCSSSSSSAGSGMTVILDNPAMVFQPVKSSVAISSAPDVLRTSTPHRAPNSDYVSLDHIPLFQTSLASAIRNPRSPLQLLAESLLERTRGVGQTARTVPDISVSFPATTNILPEANLENINKLRFTEFSEKKSLHYYKFYLSSCFPIKIRFDRLALLALIDQNVSIVENLISVVLAVLVAILGSFILKLGFYHDFYVFVFCFVIASCQYSLIKSVQPDAASPMHGYNKIIVYSRPFYFILCSSIVLIIHFVTHNLTEKVFTLYGVVINCKELLHTTQYLLLMFLLLFPLLFSIGLLPQVNTFSMYFFEQVDMFIFGGNAITGMASSVYCVVRSLTGVAVLFGFAFGALREPQSSQHVLLSIFCSLIVSISYYLSRSSGDPIPLWNLIKKNIIEEDDSDISNTSELQTDPDDLKDPLPEKLQSTICARLKTDVITCAIISTVIFGIHISASFLAFHPMFNEALWILACVLGFLIHYILPNLKKHLPWLCLSQPALKSHEYESFEVFELARVMWFEKAYVWIWFLEKNLLYPLIFISALTKDSPTIVSKFGPAVGSLIIVICSMKSLRAAYSDASKLYFILCITILFFNFDCKDSSESFIMNFFLMHIILVKLNDLLLKVSFVVTYIAPWQITWGSAFHAFAQPFSVPHSGMLFLQAFVSAILSTPLTPFLGSAIFLTSYVRPIKFWERDYNTKRVDHSNTRLSSHIDQNPGADDNNLNSIFYEHLTRSLQHSLSGDLVLGRWGPISQGDVFVLASDNLNCLVHLIEIGNGLCTFQVRGLEFRGTYCQQREVEAISEGVQEDIGCCCCEPGHLPHILSVNAAFNQRWLAWEVTATKYILEGYSISDNSAGSLLQLYDVRKILIRYYVKAIIYYTIKSSKLECWLSNPSIKAALDPTLEKSFADLDPVFNLNIDEDYDFRISGISRNNFCNLYLEWIQYCVTRRSESVDASRSSSLVSLCLCLSLLGRRTLSSTSHNTLGSVEMFLHGLHNLFKGVFDTSSARDEWVFADMELVKKVIIPSLRMSLKLHQDHFAFHDEYDEHETLYDAIRQHEESLVIAHEGDPVWRNAVLCGKPSLLALRHIQDEGSYEYKVIMLNKRYLSFRVIKVNKECVRGLWAGQQQELVYLRNKNPERGSIQNAKQALRNIINSSCDQPIGYPIYVSPLTTSYSETNPQISSIIGGHFNYKYIRDTVLDSFKRMKRRCGDGCINGSASQDDGGFYPEHSSQPAGTSEAKTRPHNS